MRHPSIRASGRLLCVIWICLWDLGFAKSIAQDEEGWMTIEQLRERVNDAFEEPENCQSLHRTNRIWFNRDEQLVIMDGYVVQREVALELFACPSGSKEHEAVVAVLARAQTVHAGLLAINAKPGSTASFEPFKPASGTTLRIYALWLDKDNKPQATLAQNWIRRMDTKTAMTFDWVFAGSKEYKDEDGKMHYLGDSGELISVSNFSTSTMDVAVRSDQSDASRMFEAYKERIPARNTPVRLVISLTDEAPNGTQTSDGVDTSDESSSGSEPKSEPKFLTEAIPDTILKCLEPKKK
jgi:hypothetical protein